MLDEMGKFSKRSRAGGVTMTWWWLFVGYVMGKVWAVLCKEWYRAKEVGKKPSATKLERLLMVYSLSDRAGGGHVGFVVGAKMRSGNIHAESGGNQMTRLISHHLRRSRITVLLASRWIDGVRNEGLYQCARLRFTCAKQ